MTKNEVDPRVLILAVIAGAAACLLIPAGQAWLCGACGLTILLVLFAYDLEDLRSFLQSLAFSAACGIGLAVTAIPVAPYLFSLPNVSDPALGGKWIPVIWAGSTILFFVIDRARMSGRVPNERPAAARGSAGRTLPTPEIPVTAPSSPEPVLVRDEPSTSPVVPAAPTAPTAVPASSGKVTSIYVNLTGEGLNLLRSVRAEHFGRDYYRIIDTMPPDETWEYPPGSVVRCRKKNLSSGKALVAYEEAPRAE